jgi:hypothetical protein
LVLHAGIRIGNRAEKPTRVSNPLAYQLRYRKSPYNGIKPCHESLRYRKSLLYQVRDQESGKALPRPGWLRLGLYLPEFEGIKATRQHWCVSLRLCHHASLAIILRSLAVLSFTVCPFPLFKMTARLSTIELLSIDSAGLQRKLDAGLLTSVELVQACLAQIDKHDQRGAKLNAMISIVPNHILMERSAQLDLERTSGRVRSPFHGIPILVKVCYFTIYQGDLTDLV